MAGFYDLIPTVTVILFILGLFGIIVYERSRSRATNESNS